MPWFNELDPDEPVDIESAAEGAERIRETRRGLIERLSTIFRGFPGEHPAREGESMLFPSAGAMVGTDAQRPNLPDREGHIWISTDTGVLHYGTKEGHWVPLVGGKGGADSHFQMRADSIFPAQPIDDNDEHVVKYEILNFDSHQGWDTEEYRFVVPFDSIVNLNVVFSVDTNSPAAFISTRLRKIPGGGIGTPLILLEQAIQLTDGFPINYGIFPVVDKAVAGDVYYATVQRVSGGAYNVNFGESTAKFSLIGFGESFDEDYDYPV